jgi:hypothetical protein
MTDESQTREKRGSDKSQKDECRNFRWVCDMVTCGTTPTAIAMRPDPVGGLNDAVVHNVGG